jgi:hypothetical protein
MTKLFHFIWYQGFYSTPEQIRPVPDMWEEANEGYSYHFWDQWSLLGLIKSKYPEYFHFYLGIGSDEPENIRIIKRCDFARLLVLHAYGGWYLDMDCVPVKPIKSLLDSHRVDHLHTQFTYSSFASGRSDLGRIASDGRAVDFDSYDLILTREHGPSPEVGGHTVCNGIMYATPGSSVLADLIDGCVKRVDQKVLKFAGPHGISSHLRQMISAVKGKVLVLPPYYFLWQTSDMGPPWANTICCHMNRLDWADKSLPKPWDI